jgi:peroxiredoxin
MRTFTLFLLSSALVLSASEATAKKKKKATPKAGDQAPAFQLRAADRTMVRLTDLAYSGRERSYAPKRPVLLDFFRTDCKPCLEAMPELVEAHDKYAKAGLHVLLVALVEEGDDDASKLQAYLDQKKLPFTVVIDRADYVSEKYLGRVVALPATFLIDREGKILKTKHDAKGSLVAYFAKDIDTALAEHKAAQKKK